MFQMFPMGSHTGSSSSAPGGLLTLAEIQAVLRQLNPSNTALRPVPSASLLTIRGDLLPPEFIARLRSGDMLKTKEEFMAKMQRIFGSANFCYLPPELAARLEYSSQFDVLTNRHAFPGPIENADAWVDEFVQGRVPENYALIGLSGLGSINSSGFHYYLVMDNVAVFISHPLSSLQGDNTEVISGALGLAKLLFAAVSEARNAGNLREDCKIVVLDSGFGESRMAVINPGQRPEDIAWINAGALTMTVAVETVPALMKR